MGFIAWAVRPLNPERFRPQRQLYTKILSARGLVHGRGQSDIIYSHTHVAIVDPFVAFPSCFPSYNEFTEIRVNVFIKQQSVSVHDRRCHNAASLYSFPIVGDDFLALLNHAELAFMARELYGQRTWLNMSRVN